MKIKIVLGSVIGILVLGIGVGIIMWLTRPQVITFKDGTKATLVGVAYGKHHVETQGQGGQWPHVEWRRAD